MQGAAAADLGDDLVLRAPLSPSSFTSSSVDRVFVEQHDTFVRPLLSALLVGAHVWQVKLETTFTAAVLLHRYYAVTRQQQPPADDDDDDDWKYVVPVCLFLACKREEEPRRLRDAINLAHMLDLAPQQPYNNKEDCPLVVWKSTPPALDEAYWAAKERMVQTEQRVLRWLIFDVAVAYPHRAVVLLLEDEAILNKLLPQRASTISAPKASKEDELPRARLMRAAFQRLHDALFSAAALQQPVLALAVAALTLAADSTCCEWTESDGLDSASLAAIRPATACLRAATDKLANK